VGKEQEIWFSKSGHWGDITGNEVMSGKLTRHALLMNDFWSIPSTVHRASKSVSNHKNAQWKIILKYSHTHFWDFYWYIKLNFEVKKCLMKFQETFVCYIGNRWHCLMLLQHKNCSFILWITLHTARNLLHTLSSVCCLWKVRQIKWWNSRSITMSFETTSHWFKQTRTLIRGKSMNVYT